MICDVGCEQRPPELFFLKELKVLYCRTGVGEVLEVGRSRPVKEVLEVGDKFGIVEEVLIGEMAHVRWVGERLNELEGRQTDVRVGK